HERDLPGVLNRVDEERIEDPVHAGHELAEAEEPADGGGAAKSPDCRGRAIEQENERGDRKEKGGKEIERRKGRCRHHARDEGREQRPPTGQPAQPVADAQQGCAHAGFPSGGTGFLGSRTLRRFTRLGSASSTSNSMPEGWVTISPRCGTRPSSETTRP